MGMKLDAADDRKSTLAAVAICIPYTLVKYSIMFGISPILATLSNASLAATKVLSF